MSETRFVYVTAGPELTGDRRIPPGPLTRLAPATSARGGAGKAGR